MIDAINFTQQNYQYKNNISFKAIKLANYGYLKEGKDVIIYQLEQSEIGYLQKLVNNLDKFFRMFDVDNESARQVLEEAFNAGIEVLKRGEAEKKARILMAFHDNKPSSILIGNVLKIDKNGGLHYSSRKNHAKNESELDWLATFNKDIPGEGQATVYEYFFTLKEDGFKQNYVRSELPEKSSAHSFYTKMGYDTLSERPREILRPNDYRYVIGKFDDKCDKIIPMKATVMDMLTTIREKADTIMRKENKDRHSVSLPEINFDCFV